MYKELLMYVFILPACTTLNSFQNKAGCYAGHKLSQPSESAPSIPPFALLTLRKEQEPSSSYDLQWGHWQQEKEEIISVSIEK